MDAFLNSLGLTLLYLALLGIGIIYAVIILIGGALHDIHIPGLDLHVGGHEIGPVHVENPLQGVDVGGDVGHPEVNVPSLSPVTVASFVTAFGAFGLIALGLFDTSAQWSLAWAAGGGLVVAVIAHFAFGYFLIAPQGSSEVKLRDIVGAVAEVITPIPADSVGEVAFVAQGGRMTYTAKSATGTPIARGTTVVIEKVIGGVAVVRPQS
jgi:membrane protein implicated in regulation of membrane protease activity